METEDICLGDPDASLTAAWKVQKVGKYLPDVISTRDRLENHVSQSRDPRLVSPPGREPQLALMPWGSLQARDLSLLGTLSLYADFIYIS